MSFPSHFASAKNFNMYILECAINDRITFIDSYSNCKDNPDYEKMLNEVREEIKEMRKRLKTIKDKK